MSCFLPMWHYSVPRRGCDDVDDHEIFFLFFVVVALGGLVVTCWVDVAVYGYRNKDG